MSTTAQKVRDARSMASLTASDLAALAGVSVSTISRAEAGKVVPAADAYLRILRWAGFIDAGDRLAPLSRPSAIWTARWLMGDLPGKPADADEWIAAWQRIRLVTDALDIPDPESLAFRAGRSATLASRPGIVTAISDLQSAQIAPRLARAGIEYALTGDEALARLGSPIIPVWPVVYVADVRAAARCLGLSPRLPGERGRQVSLLGFDGASEVGRIRMDDGAWFVSALQAVIDGYGGYGRMTEQAQRIIESWLVAR